MIGSLGNIAFVVTQKTVRTFTDFQRTASGRWAQHERLGQKPLSQFLGPGLDTVSFSMLFDASYGIKPRKEMDNLTRLERSGRAMALTIGGEAVGVSLWVITSLSQSWDVVEGHGKVMRGTAKITLQEYIAEADA